MAMRHLAFPLVLVACAAAPQLRVANYEDPRTGGASAPVSHAHNDDTLELEADAELVEPDHPAVQTPQERALVHVHTPKGICTGAVLGARLILTAHQCVGNDLKGASAVTDKDSYRVEVASSTLTWTARHVTAVVAPGCDWNRFDAAILVLDEAVDWVKPLTTATAPAPGAPVQALGYGKCRGETRPFSGRTGQIVTRESDAVVIDVAMCRGDVGGVVVDSGAGLLGVVSHQDDPNGVSRRTTTAFRLDTVPARKLLEQAEALALGGDVTKSAAVACQ
jgi:hypothetical protein